MRGTVAKLELATMLENKSWVYDIMACARRKARLWRAAENMRKSRSIIKGTTNSSTCVHSSLLREALAKKSGRADMKTNIHFHSNLDQYNSIVVEFRQCHWNYLHL